MSFGYIKLELLIIFAMMSGDHEFPLHEAQIAHMSDNSCRKTQYQPHYLRAVVDMGRYTNAILRHFPREESLGTSN